MGVDDAVGDGRGVTGEVGEAEPPPQPPMIRRPAMAAAPASFMLYNFITYLSRPSPVRCADPDLLNALGLVARAARPHGKAQRTCATLGA